MNRSNGTLSSDFIFVPNTISVLVCLLAAILVFVLKLYKKVVYRLALYQVLASLSLATVTALQPIFGNYNKDPEVYGRICIAFGWFMLYTQWMKLLFTTWIAFHLFCFAVLHKNLKKLEVLYVVISLLVPAVIAMVPLITHSYAPSMDDTRCYIYAFNDVAFIERFVLWDGPAMLILITISMAILVMVIHLARRARWRSTYKPIKDGDQFMKALQQLLPLAAFPVLSIACTIPVVVFHIYVAKGATPSEPVEILADIFYSLWSMVSGGTLIVHISVAHLCSRRRTNSGGRSPAPHSYSGHATVRIETGSYVNSATTFPLPKNSITGEE